MHKDDKVYVIEGGAKFRHLPDTTTETNLIEKLPKDQEVVLVEEPWLKVVKAGVVGWVRSDLVTSAIPAPTVVLINNTLPKFVAGQKNLANDVNTIETRKQINYEFGHKSDGLNLQCVEYVQWKVQSKLGVTIHWPADRPRDGGHWAKIFAKNNMYTVVTNPAIGCAICLTDGVSTNPDYNAIGHVAYVEEVYADGSIKISEANWPNNGIYNERILSKDKWQNQYKAQFVKFA